MENLTVIILAAGRGTRMNSIDTNKVSLKINGEPMLLRTIRVLKEAGIKNIVVVVGFAKESVTPLLDKDIIIAEQNEQLGTGHAVGCALPKLPARTHDVLIIYGDDSFLHSPTTYKKLYETHLKEKAQITFATMECQVPTGLGRILRDKNNQIIGIVEEKNANDSQRNIKEVNLGCYVIDKEYLVKNIKKIKKNKVSGEYYITDIIDIISNQKEKIASLKLTDVKWRGVNTPQDLSEAEKMLLNG
jgi:bifunctional UDP-N-acetylglucosamine pyrophosphorylase/glucosamine-1-phosphate N-acetyltransferase